VTRISPIALLALALAAGCNRGPELAPVEGRVTLEGQPVKKMIINFTPAGDTAGNGAMACTDDDGRFTLLDARGGTGAYAGEYTVSFYPSASPAVQADPALDVVLAPKRGAFPAIYLDPRGTPLKATVPKEGGTIDVILTRSGQGATTKTTPRTNG
jgi:hypothetical protein